jgi:hypothetical protein
MMSTPFRFRAAMALPLAAVLACARRPAEAAPLTADTALSTADTTRPPAASSAPTDSFPWLVVDRAARTALLDLVVTRKPGAPSAMINGHRAGEIRIIVPLGWTVKWNWQSADSTAPHSLVVMVQREKIPLEGGRASFSNAMTRMVTEGLRTGQTDQSTFVAEEAGWYWMMCGVPGHALEGEWLELRVDPEAKTAGVEGKKKA